VITDTQILSYYFKGAMALQEEPVRISSITAAEFLLIQSAEHNTANYYPILPSKRFFDGLGAPVRVGFDSRLQAARGKRRTDQLILGFGPSVPTYVEFGSIAITQLINLRCDHLYLASISPLAKATQKKLAAKFRFLLDHDVFCFALTPFIASVGLNLLGLFMDRYQLKTNKRNTINDVLVLATAIHHEMGLFTKDSLLTRFAAEVMAAPLAADGDCLHVDFSLPGAVDRRKSLESKGFVNRGWQVRERRSGGRPN